MAAKTQRQEAVKPKAQRKSAASLTDTPLAAGSQPDEQLLPPWSVFITNQERMDGWVLGNNQGYAAGYADGQLKATAAYTRRLLRRRLGESAVKQLAPQLKPLRLDQLQELSEALFDFNTPDEVTAWLNKQTR